MRTAYRLARTKAAESGRVRRGQAIPARIGAAIAIAIVAIGIPAAASGSGGKKPSPPPVCKIGPSPLPFSNHVELTGGCKVNGKPVASKWTWQTSGETDASGGPLPATTSSGTGVNIPIPIVGGYKLQIAAKVSTAKTSAHQAGHATGNATATLGGYTAIGTQVPSVESYNGSGAAYCDWETSAAGSSYLPTLNVAATSPTVTLPSTFHCGPGSIMGACHWEATPPEPPTDPLPNRDGVVTTTGLTIYGGRVVCANGYTAVPLTRIYFTYADGQTQADSCELELRGVISFTIPASWNANFVSFYVDLLTYGPDGGYNANQAIQSSYGTRTRGSIDPCQTYHLPPFKP